MFTESDSLNARWPDAIEKATNNAAHAAQPSGVRRPGRSKLRTVEQIPISWRSCVAAPGDGRTPGLVPLSRIELESTV